MLAERYIQPGLAFCLERGLDAWQGMLTTLAAEAALARDVGTRQGAPPRRSWPGKRRVRTCARQCLGDVGRVRARRGEPGYWPLLDEAAAIAKAAPVAQAALLVAAARAEGRVAGGTGAADR